MGWRGKLVFLLVVYFAGFASAVYYLAPSGREGSQADSYYNSNDSSQNDSNVVLFERFCDKCDKVYTKAYASFANVDWTGLKEKFNRGVQKLIEKVKSSRSSSSDEGSEDK